MNKTWSISNSKTNFERIKNNPKEWYTYHTLYSQARKEWPVIPYKEIAKKINRGDESLIVADLGCGEKLLSKEIKKKKILSFDLHPIDKTVTQADISNVPLIDKSVNIAVLSLALMGSNYLDYLDEAYRILKPLGMLYIAEPKKKEKGLKKNF